MNTAKDALQDAKDAADDAIDAAQDLCKAAADVLDAAGDALEAYKEASDKVMDGLADAIVKLEQTAEYIAYQAAMEVLKALEKASAEVLLLVNEGLDAFKDDLYTAERIVDYAVSSDVFDILSIELSGSLQGLLRHHQLFDATIEMVIFGKHHTYHCQLGTSSSRKRDDSGAVGHFTTTTLSADLFNQTWAAAKDEWPLGIHTHHSLSPLFSARESSCNFQTLDLV